MPALLARSRRPQLLTGFTIALVALFALSLGVAGAAAAPQAGAKGERKAAKHGKKHKAGKAKARAQRGKAQRRSRRHHRVRRDLVRGRSGLAGNKAISGRDKAPQAEPAAVSTEGVIDAGFEAGLYNWNTAGVGDVIPTVAGGPVRSGAYSGAFALSGEQDRSELILGGNGNGSVNQAIFLDEGDEGFYAFSFYIESMTYGRPGGHNLIMQFKGDDDGSPNFGLQLWDYEGDDGESGGRGLWSHSDAMDGDRFLAPAAEQTWHDVVIHFKASGVGAGFYRVYLDGQLVDSRDGVSIIPSDASYVYIKTGLYRNGEEIPGTSQLRIDAAKFGPTAAAVAVS